MLIETLGVFPPGICVKLKNGEIAVVTARSAENSLKCKAISVCKQEHQVFPSLFLRDASEARYAIDSHYHLDEKLGIDMRKLFSVAVIAA